MKNQQIFRHTAMAVGMIVFIITSSFSQSDSKSAELHKELNGGNVDKVMQLLEQDITLLEAPNPRGSSPLTVAAADGYTDLVKFLVNKGADVNSSNTYGNTPLHYSAWASDFESFKFLCENGAKLDARNINGQSVLQYSCMGGNPDIFKYCISKGMDINAKLEDGSTLIHWAASGGNIDIFKYLEEKGFDVKSKDKDGSLPVFWAASSNKLDMVKYLVEQKGIDVNIKDDLGFCPLKSAIERGGYDVAKYLLDKGADINVKMENHQSWLGIASESNNTELVKLLIDKGCEINEFDDFGNTPLITAVGHGNFDVVKVLVENGAKLNPGLCTRESCTSSGTAPLHAASWRSPVMVEYLISKGSDINKKDNNGNTALHSAVQSDSIRSVEILCENKCDINVQNNLGQTPIMLAICRNRNETVKTLLKYNADISITDNTGKSPLHYAAVSGYGDICDLLISKGAELNKKDKNNRTPVYYAGYYGNAGITEKLKKADAASETNSSEETQYLSKKMNEGEAVLWYLNHSGWAVKTKNHLLIFDYWQLTGDPDVACLNNGRINPQEIKDQNVIVFVSHTHQDHFSTNIFDWKKTVNNTNYILGFETGLYKDYTYISPRSEKTIDGVKITSISSTDSGEGFMVEADGVTIYHPGDHANRFREEDKAFSDEIDFLSEKYSNIDIAFVPITGCSFRDKVALVKGNDYLVGKFNPELVLPMHGSGSEHKFIEYADERNKINNTSVYHYLINKGDRMFYKQQNVKLGSVPDENK